jgi:hypothetical protein
MAQELINSLSKTPTEAIAIALFVAVNTNDLTIKKNKFDIGINEEHFKVEIKKE